MARKVVGVQGTSRFLVALSDPKHVHAQAVVVEKRGGRFLAGPAALPLQSFLARGYWESWSGSAAEARAILVAVPHHVPVLIPLPT